MALVTVERGANSDSSCGSMVLHIVKRYNLLQRKRPSEFLRGHMEKYCLICVHFEKRDGKNFAVKPIIPTQTRISRGKR